MATNALNGKYHHLYMNNPTAGKNDGTQISEDRTFLSPLSVVLDASKNESKVIKCAVRCETGYETVGNLTITPVYWNGTTYETTGGNIDKYKVALDPSTAGVQKSTFTDNLVNGDTITFDGSSYVAGTDFNVGTSKEDTALNISVIIEKNHPLYKVSIEGAVLTIKEREAGGGNNPTGITCTRSVITNEKISSSRAVEDGLMDVLGDWKDSITITDAIFDRNYIFWIKISSAETEDPQKDDTIAIKTSTTIQAS